MSVKATNIVFGGIALGAIVASAWPQVPPPSDAAAVLRQARTYQLQFRAGQYDVEPKCIAMLEEATKADPENADLWNALGFAYLSQAAGTMLTGGKPADAMATTQKGVQTLERALKLNPDQAEALATHGAQQATMGSLGRMPDLAGKGLAEMNRSVELAPNSVHSHLARGLVGLILPDALRNHTAEAEDLDFLVKNAGRGRPGDYLRIMRGDLYFELGKPDLAREQYEIVGKSASSAATEARARLTALARGGVADADIGKLRGLAGADCAMCHGR